MTLEDQQVIVGRINKSSGIIYVLQGVFGSPVGKGKGYFSFPLREVLCEAEPDSFEDYKDCFLNGELVIASYIFEIPKSPSYS